MTTIEIIRDLCKKNGISVTQLEVELGYSNGSISKTTVKAMKSDRLLEISKYFNVSMEYLMGEETKDYYIDRNTAEIAQQLYENKEMRVLFDAARDAQPEDLKTVYDMLLALKRKEKGD